MQHVLRYGETSFPVDLPERKIGIVVEPRSGFVSKSIGDAVREALDHPIGTGPLETVVRPGESVCVVISDATRAWQRPAEVLNALLPRLFEAGIRPQDVLILSARGTHRPQSEEELRELVGPENYGLVRVADHDPLDPAGLTLVGTTSRGTPVLLNSAAVNADRVILTGSVVHHFLAGFSGGRKSVVPGIAAMETVQKNHSLSLADDGFDPDVRSGNLANNSVHLDMLEAASFLKSDFLVNTVLNEEHRAVGAFAGDPVLAHERACELVDRMNRIPIPRRYPVVIASAGGYPKDINVYQPLKTLCHMVACAEPGGTMIMLSESREGFGSPDTEEQITRYTNMADRSAALRAHYTIGGATGFLYADAAEKYNFIYVTAFGAEHFANTRMRIVRSLREALSLVPDIPDGGVCLLPSGSVTLPEVTV